MRLLTIDGKYVRTPNGIAKAPSGDGKAIEVSSKEELNALDKTENVGKFVIYDDALYLITED